MKPSAASWSSTKPATSVANDVNLAESAWRDLDEIYDWIADQSDPDTALAYVSRILRLCNSLSEFPQRGALRDDLAENIRTIVFERRATIAYRVTNDAVLVLRVLHWGRDAQSAFAPTP